jgi:ribosome assembly protein 4
LESSDEKYAFYTNSVEILKNLGDTLEEIDHKTEGTVVVVYSPIAVFKVRPVTRCSSEIQGHTEAILTVSFSPEGRYLASGSGDTTTRLWDLTSESPEFTLEGHKSHILAICWAPDSKKICTGCKSGQLRLWSPKTGKQIGKVMTGHKQWITGIAWEPLHQDGSARRFISSSKDTNAIIWDAVKQVKLITLSNHQSSVTSVVWGGQGLIYTGSQDRIVSVWRPDGTYCRALRGHAHWVNSLALNTSYITRTGAFEPAKAKQSNQLSEDPATLQKEARVLYDKYLKCKIDFPEIFLFISLAIGGFERLCSASDDHTLFLWKPESEKKPLSRLTGHQATINDVKFSPDARYLASASFDKSVKLWCGKTGKFICAFRGHVRPVYTLAWSLDSRMIVSGSSDSTLKLFEVSSRKVYFIQWLSSSTPVKLLKDLPGHADEVYGVDWSPDGQKVASGGKDRALRLWRK